MSVPAPPPITLRERIAYLGARIGFALFGALPIDLASAIGGWLARRIGPQLPVHQVAARNLRRALSDLDEAAVRRVLAGMWDNLGRTVAEYPHLAAFRFEPGNGRVEIVGGDHFDALRDDGIAGFFFSAHFGNWEILPLAASQRGCPLLLVYRAANNPLVERLVQRARTGTGGRHVPKGIKAARELLSALKAGAHIAMLVDQKANDGIPVPFFGREAMTAPALAELALRFRCPVAPVRVDRIAGARFRITVLPPLRFEDTGDRIADVRRAMTQVNALIEGWIRERPEQWFWLHRRWGKD